MVQIYARRNTSSRVLSVLLLMFSTAVRDVRRTHGNALVGLLMNMLQSIIMVAVFFFMFELLGLRGNAIRGDFLLYVMSGIFMFMTHTKAVAGVVASDGPTSPMMKHAPMNPIISISGAALSALYTQFLSAVVILLLYHVIVQPIKIHDPLFSFYMLLLSWGTGVSLGMIFKAAMPWQPDFFGVISQLYQRANMVASGKMFVANAMPSFILGFFDWNPLFHTIDQGRGFIFLNYQPRYSSIEYPLMFMAITLVIGLMGTFYTRKYASLSWTSKQ